MLQVDIVQKIVIVKIVLIKKELQLLYIRISKHMDVIVKKQLVPKDIVNVI